MGEGQLVFDQEIIRAAQWLTPAVLGLVVSVALRRFYVLRRVILVLVLVYVVYLGERVIVPGYFSGLTKLAQGLVEPKFEGIPTIDKHVADRYIISRVGRDHFDLFVLDPARSEKVNGSVRAYGYRLVYHFTSIREYQVDDTVEIVVRNGAVESAEFIPNCVADTTLCEFEVGREEAITVARENGLWAADLEIGTTTLVENGLAIEVVSCGLGQRMLIDYRDGRVLAKGETKCE